MYNKALDAFMAVADSGSFTKAAQQLFISHTAVIKQINALESHLGVKLFRRTNQGVTMTAAGQCLYAKAAEIMRFSEKAIGEIQAAYLVSPQTIRVGTSLFYPAHIFMDLWDTVSDRCPRYQLKIVSIGSDEQRFAGFNTDYDFIVGPYNTVDSNADFPFIPIGRYRFCLAMPKRHPLAQNSTLRLMDLRGERLMIMKPGNSEINDRIREDVLCHYPEITIVDISPHYGVRTFNQCLESGAILLSLECWKDVHPGLVTIPLEENYSLPYGIVTSKRPEPGMRGFITALQECLDK